MNQDTAFQDSGAAAMEEEKPPASGPEAAHRQFTKQLTDVSSAQQVLDILDGQLDGELLNHVHISAAFTRLARHKAGFDRAMQQSHVIKRLVVRVLDVLAIDELPARESANVLWARVVVSMIFNSLKSELQPFL